MDIAHNGMTFAQRMAAWWYWVRSGVLPNPTRAQIQHMANQQVGPSCIPCNRSRLLVVAGGSPARHPALFSDEFFQSLARAPWPGNVRELRNYLECCLVFGKRLPLPAAWPSPEPGASISIDIDAPYAVARAQCIADFERVFAGAALRRGGGNIGRAALQIGIDRAHLWRIVKRARQD